MSLLEDAYLPEATTLFDLSTLESLEMTISHTPAMGEVHDCLQAQSLTRISLLSTSTWRYLVPSPRDEEPWAIYNTPLHPRNTCPKYWLKQISTFPITETLDRTNTHSTNKVNFRVEWVLTPNQRKQFKFTGSDKLRLVMYIDIDFYTFPNIFLYIFTYLTLLYIFLYMF